MGERNIQKIGEVTLDYTFYSGTDLYSDGIIEDKLLETFRDGKAEKVLYCSNEWPILYHLSDIRENAIEWYSFKTDSEVLEIGAGCGAITSILSAKSKSVTCVELSEKRSRINAERNKDKNNIKIFLGNFQDIEPSLGKYDVITLIGVLEYAKLYINDENPYIKMLSIIQNHLKEDGKLIIAIENKMGLKYINGAPEDHIGQPYVGINDYISEGSVRTFSLKEIEKLLKKTGYESNKFYYPIPDYKLPAVIYSSDYLPKPGDIRTYKTNYSNIRLYSFYEDIMNDQLAYDEMFEYMANSYIVIAGKSVKEDVVFSKYNRERKRKYRICTTIKKDKESYKVVKKPLCNEAKNHILDLKYNEERWVNLNHELHKVEGYIEDGSYVSTLIKGETLEEKLYELRNDESLFVDKVLEFINKYYSVNDDVLIPFEKTEMFKTIFGDVEINETKSLRITNIDMLFSNIIINDDNKAFIYDFEWIFEFQIPYRYVLWRAAKEAYYKYYVYLKNKINISCYYDKLGFDKEETDIYITMENNFNEYVCGKDSVEVYTKNYVKSGMMANMIMG